MGIRSFFAKPLARYIFQKTQADSKQAVKVQKDIFQSLIRKAQNTLFGKDHDFVSIKNHQDYIKRVPIRNYEALRPYVERVKLGESNILWPNQTIYFAKTSGTTSGAKYIPITKDSIPNHINSARNALLLYMHHSKNYDFIDRKLIFLSGSPVLDEIGGIPSGRLSGIVNHHIPNYLRTNQLPKYATNCIEDWETKVGEIVKETITQDMGLISGIPPWMQMYFDQLTEQSGKRVGELFPNLSLIIHGGVNFKPYRQKLSESLGRAIDMIETFPASEGFFAFQESPHHEGLLLNINSGIFFEFVPALEIFNPDPPRLSLAEVELGVNYALIINNNAGLWAYDIGDTVQFVSKDPYRVVVSGRTKHFISAFGEHVIGQEVEQSLLKVAEANRVAVREFTVAPMIGPDNGQSYHEWLIEFEEIPADLEAFALKIDAELQQRNSYYADLIQGKILRPLVITPLQKQAFQRYMKSIGRLGGQNKVPRLSNDRKIANELCKFAV